MNRVHNISNPAAATIYFQYDRQGNITTRGSDQYVFDMANRMTSATNATGKTTYVYDRLGRRVSTVKPDQSKQIHVYTQDGVLVMSTNQAGTGAVAETRYVYLNGSQIAELGIAFIHTDGLRSPVVRVDGNKVILSRTRYEPYGLTAAGATPTVGYTGHVNDANTGLVYMQQRYYDPVAARFMSIDPVVTDANTGGSFNRYAYANNSPYKYVDPDGRDAADKFNDQYKRDAESGNRKIWAPFEPVAIAVTAGMAVVPAAVAIGGEVAAASAVKAVDKGVRITKQVLERKSAGRDGAQSKQIIEKRDGKMNSRTHEVTKDGEVIHQHQNHAGKYGGERQFPEEWTGTKTINAPYENIPPSFGPDKIPSGGVRY